MSVRISLLRAYRAHMSACESIARSLREVEAMRDEAANELMDMVETTETADGCRLTVVEGADGKRVLVVVEESR